MSKKTKEMFMSTLDKLFYSKCLIINNLDKTSLLDMFLKMSFPV